MTGGRHRPEGRADIRSEDRADTAGAPTAPFPPLDTPTAEFPAVEPDDRARDRAAEPPDDRGGADDRAADRAPAAEARPSMLEQLGGVPGMIASTIPVVVFVVVNSITSLTPAIIAALAVGVGIAVWRLVRKEPLQPAVSGLFGVGVGAFVAWRTGEAKGYFLVGIWYSAVLCVVFLASVLARWPLAGVIWHGLNGDGQGWRAEKALLRAYSLATLLWAAVFAGRFVVQQWLYDTDQTGWLAAARIGMGIPLTAVALLGTIWAVRRAHKRLAPADGP